MTKLERYMAMGHQAGCPRSQMDNFVGAGVILQERQLAASAAARLCDGADGPTGRRPSATAGPVEAARATGSWRRWALTTVSVCRA
jgi:hypothetical protein